MFTLLKVQWMGTETKANVSPSVIFKGSSLSIPDQCCLGKSGLRAGVCLVPLTIFFTLLPCVTAYRAEPLACHHLALGIASAHP